MCQCKKEEVVEVVAVVRLEMIKNKEMIAHNNPEVRVAPDHQVRDSPAAKVKDLEVNNVVVEVNRAEEDHNLKGPCHNEKAEVDLIEDQEVIGAQIDLIQDKEGEEIAEAEAVEEDRDQGHTGEIAGIVEEVEAEIEGEATVHVVEDIEMIVDKQVLSGVKTLEYSWAV